MPFPSSKTTFTDPAGTSFLAGTPAGGANAVDHADLHTDINDTVEAVEDTLGTTAGTSVLKHYAAGEFPVRHTGVAATGTLVQTLVGGTLNNSTMSGTIIYGDNAPNISPKARAWLNGDQLNLVNNTWTKVTLNAETYDVGADFDSTTNNRFVAPVSGYYSIKASVLFLNLVADTRYAIGIYADGALVAHSISACGGVTDAVSATVSDTIYVAATSYVELYARSNSGGNTVDVEGLTGSTWMSVHLISI